MRPCRRGTVRIVGLAMGIAAALVILGSTALAADRWRDMPNARWFLDYGVTAAEADTVADGYPDGTFRPYRPVTRAEFSKMAVDGLDVPLRNPTTASFRDVARGSTFYVYVEGARAARIISGYPDRYFSPSALISREQANSILGRYLAQAERKARGTIKGRVGIEYPTLQAWYEAEGLFFLGGFTDRGLLSAIHRPGTAYLVYHDVVKGAKFKANPRGSLTRAQAVAMVLRTLDAVAEVTDATLPPAPTDLATIPLSPSTDERPFLTGKTIPDGLLAVYESAGQGTFEIAQGTADGNGNFAIKLPTLLEGTHVLITRVKNNAGRISAPSAPLTYVVDRTNPEATISKPSADGAVASDRPAFEVDATDAGSGVAVVTFESRLVAGDPSYEVVSVDTETPFAAQWGSRTLVDGKYEFRARVRDQAGNEVVVGPVTVVVDTQKPAVEVNLPQPQPPGTIYYTTLRQPLLVASATDPPKTTGVEASGPARVDFRYALKGDLPVDKADWTPTDFTLLWSDGATGSGQTTFAATWGDVQLAENGDYILAVQAFDRAGNGSDLVTQEVIVDSAAPVLTLTAPQTGESVPDSTDFTITWTLTDASAVETVKLEYSANGGTTWTTIAAAAPNTGTRVWPVPSVVTDISTYRVRITATDAAGPILGDIPGHTATVVSGLFTVTEVPAPATGLVASDPDASWPEIDGRDFSLNWTPSASTDVVQQDLLILPDGVAPVLSGPGAHTVVAAGLAPGVNTWTGTALLIADSAGAAFLPDKNYRLFVVATDGAGKARVSAGALWAALPPAAPGLTSAADADRSPGIDGRDFTLSWIPSSSGDVIAQEIYLLPAGTALDLTAHTPAAALAGNTITAWTGLGSLGTDALGSALQQGVYDAYVVAVSDDGRRTASPKRTLVVVSP